MNRTQKTVLGVFLALALMLAATVAWAASTVVNDGFVTVRVHERGAGGTHLYLPIPGAAVRAAALAVRLDGRAQRRLQTELAEVGPVLAALGKQLEKCPDARLVEVESEDEHIVIEKRGGSLRIAVDDRGDQVRITIPMRLASDLLDHFGTAL